MGIYGALSTAVTGLRAQSFALENISGNIANSQTTGYKRVETDFLDLIPDAPLKRQVPGAVLAQSRGTNTVQGDVKTSSIDTNHRAQRLRLLRRRAAHRPGRRQLDLRRRQLLHAPRRLRHGQERLPRQRRRLLPQGPADRYRDRQRLGLGAGGDQDLQRLPAGADDHPHQLPLNLPRCRKNGAYKPGAEGSELFQPGDFMALAADTPATTTGAALTGANDADTVMAAGESLTINVNGTAVTFDFYDSSAGAYAGTNIGIDVDDTTPDHASRRR